MLKLKPAYSFFGELTENKPEEITLEDIEELDVFYGENDGGEDVIRVGYSWGGNYGLFSSSVYLSGTQEGLSEEALEEYAGMVALALENELQPMKGVSVEGKKPENRYI